MDLKNFIKEVTNSIVKASQELSNELGREISVHDKDNKNIEFDLAVTVEEIKSISRGGGLNIQVLSAGLKGNNETKNSTISRIRFSLFVHSMTKNEQEKNQKEIAQYQSKN